MRRRTRAGHVSAVSAAARALRSIPRSLLIANAVLLTVVIDALLWYRWAVTQDAGWIFAAGVLTLLVLTLLLNLHRLQLPQGKRTYATSDSRQEAPRNAVTSNPPPLPLPSLLPSSPPPPSLQSLPPPPSSPQPPL